MVGNYFNKYSSDKKFKGYPHFDNSSFSDLAVFFSPIPRVKTCRIALTFPGSYKEVELQDCIIQQLLKRIMTGSPNSRLRKVLRYDTGLVYEVTMESVRYQLFGYIDITTQTDPQNLFRVVDAIIQSLLYLKAFGPTEEEYESAKNHHINRVLIDDDRPDYVLGMMREALMNKGVVSTEDYIELVKSLDINLVKPFIDKYWNFSKANLIVSGFVTDSVENRMILLNLLRKLSI
ncbi:insulinase family protein [Candidatus Daviesbacteria bacterium]|nr:insulinase family protein [Candidatus Daviesbacteria bacterium]